MSLPGKTRTCLITAALLGLAAVCAGAAKEAVILPAGDPAHPENKIEPGAALRANSVVGVLKKP